MSDQQKEFKEAEATYKIIRNAFCSHEMNQQGKIWYHCTQAEILGKKESFLKGFLDILYFSAIQFSFMSAGYLLKSKSFFCFVLMIACTVLAAFLLAPIMFRAKRFKQFEEYIKSL